MFMKILFVLIVVIGIIYYIKSQKQKNLQEEINPLLKDEDRYKTDKKVIEKAIKEKDWDTLNDMLDSSTSDFPDLIKIIKKAIKDR